MFKYKFWKFFDTVKYLLSAESSGTESAENWLCNHIVAEKTDEEIQYIKTNLGYWKWRLTISYMIK